MIDISANILGKRGTMSSEVYIDERRIAEVYGNYMTLFKSTKS